PAGRRGAWSLAGAYSACGPRPPCPPVRGAGVFELWQPAARRHPDLELAAAAADDRTVGIRRIERIEQPAAPRAAAAAGRDVSATPTGRCHPACLHQRLA